MFRAVGMTAYAVLDSCRSPHACRSESSRGRLVAEPESPTRTPYQRDRDRILHSGAFRKLKYKTQVFVYHEGDYYRTRLSHSLEVSQIARSLARVLGLNEDLVEAIALAHDLGHTPFGHVGEEALNDVMAGFGGFDHNDHTLRILTRLERRYAGFDGLNLTWETLEGVVKHNGPMLPAPAESTLPPCIDAFRAVCDLALDTYPSAEAQIAALSDDIAYNSHDLDDGLRAGLFTLQEIAEVPLIGRMVRALTEAYPGLERPRLVHELNRRLITLMVTDVLEETGRRMANLSGTGPDVIRQAGYPVVAFSDGFLAEERQLRAFLFTRMYRHYRVNRAMSKARRVIVALFQHFHDEPTCLPTEWQVDLTLCGDPADHTVRARLVADYIAGMTDRYALWEHRRVLDPYERS